MSLLTQNPSQPVTGLPLGNLADLGSPPSKLPCVGPKIERVLKSQSDSTHGGGTRNEHTVSA
jgi:hypothetical protein